MAHRRNPADGIYKSSSYRPSHARSDVDQEESDNEDYDPTHPRTEPGETLDLSQRPQVIPTNPTHYVADTTDLERIGSLSALCSDFVKIRFDDFRRCSHFIEAEPQVVDEDLDALKHEALLAYGRRQDGLGDRCMHRWLIIRECHSLSNRRIREYFDKLALRKNTYNDFQRDFLTVTDRLKNHAPAYLRQHESVSHSSTRLSQLPSRIADWSPRITAIVNPVYQGGNQASTPIQIPGRRAETREQESNARETGRYTSFDGDRIVSPRALSPAPSSNPYAEMDQQSRVYTPTGQNLAYRPHPAQRRSSMSVTGITQGPRPSVPRALLPITDDFSRHQPTANEYFRSGTNNPYRITQETSRSRTQEFSPTRSERRLERAQTSETSSRLLEYPQSSADDTFREGINDPPRDTDDDRLPRHHQPLGIESCRADVNSSYHSSHAALPTTRARSFAQPSLEGQGDLTRSLETPTRPVQALSSSRAEPETYPPGNPTVVIRPQEATIEPSILPGASIDIQAEQTETNNAWYSVRKDGKNFFRAGRVFKIIWHTPAGTNRQGQFNQSNNIMDGPLNSKIHTKTMWMLVVFRKHGYSICCPISTYDGNGLSRKHLPQQEIRAHAVIHSSNTNPKIFHDEPKMGKHPIPVDMARGQPDLDKASRVHFGKFHTVEWNVFVMNVGTVKKGYEEDVRNNFLRELLGPNPSSALTGQ